MDNFSGKCMLRLESTYRTNQVLDRLQHTPLIGKKIPSSLYGHSSLKTLVMVLGAIRGLAGAIAGKVLFFFCLTIISFWGKRANGGDVFLHVYFFCTLVGALFYLYIFNAEEEKRYAITLLRMDARGYTLWTFGREALVLLICYGLFFGIGYSRLGISLTEALFAPFFAIGVKLWSIFVHLLYYQRKKGYVNNERVGNILVLVGVCLLVIGLLPVINRKMGPLGNMELFMGIGALGIIPGGISLLRFPYFFQLQKEILLEEGRQDLSLESIDTKAQKDLIVEDSTLKSDRMGLEFLNELFIKRHRKILWRSSKRSAVICLVLLLGMAVATYFYPKVGLGYKEAITQRVGLIFFLFYLMNRGEQLTKTMFVNCDEAMLTYPMYKKGETILQLFKIRLREIIKVNLLPALAFVVGSFVCFWMTGEKNLVFYGVVAVLAILLSVFFSCLYLSLYYLFQPYTNGVNMRSGVYKKVVFITQLLCMFSSRYDVSFRLAVPGVFIFCILYIVLSFYLVKRYAPLTFRLHKD